MELENDFKAFLSEIRPTDKQRGDMQTGHKTLRERLDADEKVKQIVVSDFLQGSYRRSTAVRPIGDARSDVDIILVTKLSETEYTPAKAMDVFAPFLDKHYKGKWRRQGRSLGIELSYVELDLVITSAPSESEQGILKSAAVRATESIEEAQDLRFNAKWIDPSARYLNKRAALLLAESARDAEWKSSPLRIPDRNAGLWESTHPIQQIQWTRDKNARTGTHFVNVVKAIKWWKLENHPDLESPKGFPLERIIGECCPDGISSVAIGIAATLEEIVNRFAPHIHANSKPSLPDYGVPSHDVLAKISKEDFKRFYKFVSVAASLAKEALDSTDRQESGNLWRKLLGNRFPEPPKGGDGGKGFRTPSGPAVPGQGRFA